jgi:hypothetical protein
VPQDRIVFRHERHFTTVGRLLRDISEATTAWDRRLAAGRLECALADLQAERAGGDDLPPPPLPSRETAVTLPEPEGVRFYGLSLEGFAMAARSWQRARGDGRPAWVLGLRTMGSLLAPVVLYALTGAGHRCSTLRPVGPPQDRRLRVLPSLHAALAAWPGDFLIVDEGPGLSGSSFGGTVRYLRELEVAGERIAVLPSWTPAAERLGNAYAAREWAGWNLYPAPELAPPEGVTADMSAGQWRAALGIHGDIPVWGQHERRKYLADGGRSVVKFAGFGAYGRETLARARRLAQAGWGPALPDASAAEASAGWVRYRRLGVAPLPRHPPPDWCKFAGRYLAWVRSEFRLGGPQPPSPALLEMVRANLGSSAEPPQSAAVALDGRMFPEEWGRTASGWVKFDATDHGDDPFFPGPADIAWDLAAIRVEFGRATGDEVAAVYRRHSGETEDALAPRLRWHQAAYAAFRAAYCQLAASQTHGRDAVGFAAAALRYRAAVSRMKARILAADSLGDSKSVRHSTSGESGGS